MNRIISKEAEFTVLNYVKHNRPKKVEANEFKKVMLRELNLVVATLLPQQSYAHTTFHFLQCGFQREKLICKFFHFANKYRALLFKFDSCNKADFGHLSQPFSLLAF